MINVIETKHCCGCNACEQACPKNCINFTTDSEGFKYPIVNEDQCIDCGLCEKVCPMLNIATPVEPLSYEAMVLCDMQKRLESSSGGAFTAIAEEVIKRGGVVFGASFTENWHVVHTEAETTQDIQKFRGSKYVQSDTQQTYSQVKKYLKQDRWVLFSGTPCQVRGLLLYLRKQYDKLITVDFICHGVPSHDVLMAYVKDELKRCGQSSVIKNIHFRDKTNGWKRYCFALSISGTNDSDAESLKTTPLLCLKSAYMKGFGKKLYLRPSCYNCPAKNFTSGSDFTLADYWRVEEQHPEMDDDKGTSLVSINTEKASVFMSTLSALKRKVVDFQTAYKIQTALFKSMPKPPERNEFWESDWQNDFINVVNKIADRKTVAQRFILSIKYILRTLGVKKLIKKIHR